MQWNIAFISDSNDILCHVHLLCYALYWIKHHNSADISVWLDNN